MNGFTIGSLAIACALAFAIKASAEESTLEKTEAVANKATDSVKESYRDVKDKTCEMVNGKIHCVGKKIMNKAKTLGDKTETKAKEVKNKVD
ncbi:MAG: hypothetical protein JSU04_00965 [Bdellovibrionales bacterium]|nr:hypothetical protein [Bdellovibrionales bacterium]